MSQAEPNVLSARSSSRSIPSAAFALLLIPFVAALVIAQAAWTHPSAGAGAATTGDPLLAPAMVEFREAERLSALPASDPLLAPAAIEFRQTERLSAVPAGDPLLAPAIVEFRRGERIGAVDDR